MCTNIQSALTAKEVESQEQEQKFVMAMQYMETQAIKINAMQTELAIYQSFIKSKGLEPPVISGEMAVTLESSEIKLNRYTNNNTPKMSESNKKSNRLCKLREYPETSKSMETVRNSDLDNYYNSGRRWSEEVKTNPLHILFFLYMYSNFFFD